MGQLVTQPFELTPPQQDSMLAVIERAVTSPDFDVNKLQQLLEMRERWEANEAKKAFVSSMKAFKQNPPQIIKNKAVDFNTTHYKYATLDSVCGAITDSLSAVGISHRWKVEQSTEAGNSWLRVTCILTHELGHSEETALVGNPDTSGSKNAIQAVGSAVTYLQRYTLLAATGLAAANGDDDGRGSGQPVGPRMDAAELSEKLEYLENASSREELEKMFRQYYSEAKKLNDQAAMKAIIGKKDEQKRRFM